MPLLRHHEMIALCAAGLRERKVDPSNIRTLRDGHPRRRTQSSSMIDTARDRASSLYICKQSILCFMA